MATDGEENSNSGIFVMEKWVYFRKVGFSSFFYIAASTTIYIQLGALKSVQKSAYIKYKK